MQVVCTRCFSAGKPKRVTRGSMLVELALWLCFLVPGLIYSLWRLTTRYDGCRVCGAAEVVPANSPAAQRIIGGT